MFNYFEEKEWKYMVIKISPLINFQNIELILSHCSQQFVT